MKILHFLHFSKQIQDLSIEFSILDIHFYSLMASIKILVLIFLLSLQSYTQYPNKCCTSYDKSNLICLTCPDGTYYYGNNCIPDIDNCEDFQQCGICSKCANGFNLVDSDVSGKKVKKCQQLSSYLPIDVQKKTQQGPSYDAYIISDDYMKNIHKQLKPGKLLSAYHKSSPNAIQLIKIQYEVAQADGQSSKFYRTTMQIDLNKYQFKQIDFNEIQKTDLGNIRAEKIDGSGVKSKEKVGIDTSGGIGDTSVNGEYLEKVLDLREATNLKIVQAVDVIVRGSNLIYKKVVAVKIKTNGSGKQFIEITYLGNDENNHVFLIQTASRRVVTVDGVQVLATNSKATTQPIKKPQPIPEPMKPVLPTVAPVVVVSAPPATPIASPTKIVDVVNNKQTPSTLPNATPTTPPAPKPAEADVNKQPAKIPPQILNFSPPASSAPSSKQPAPTQSATQQTQQTQPTQPTPPAPPTPPSVPTTPVSQTTAAPSPDPQTGFWPKQPTSTYTKQDNIEVLKDLKFLVAKDLLNKKLQGYQDILPTSCYSKTEPNIKIFLMLFNKPQGIQTQTIVKVNFISYASELIYQHKVGIVQKPAPPSSSQSRIYTPKEIAQVIKTSYFISAAIQVSKAPNGYNSDNLISVAVNDDEPNTIYYRSVYNVNGKLYEVESLTKKKLRIGQLVSEKDVTPPGAVINLIKPKPQTKPQNTDPVVNTQDQGASSPPASSTSTSVTPISSPPAPTPPTPPTVDSNPISSPKPVNPPVTPPVPQEVKPTPPPTNSNSKPQPVNNQKPSPPTKQPEQPEKVAPVVKTPPPAPKPVDCEFPKITPKFDDLLKFSPNTELPQSVLTQIGGFSQILQNAAKTDANYLRIESFVECTSSKIIKDSQILGVFSKGSGFSSQFKIYYETPRKVIYQVFVTIDRLKSKIYVINFNPISFGVQ